MFIDFFTRVYIILESKFARDLNFSEFLVNNITVAHPIT